MNLIQHWIDGKLLATAPERTGPVFNPATGEQTAEVAFACDDFVWILEPPFNGTVDEMVATAAAVLATEECRAG